MKRQTLSGCDLQSRGDVRQRVFGYHVGLPTGRCAGATVPSTHRRSERPSKQGPAEELSASHDSVSLYFSRAFSFTAIPSTGPGINVANPSLAVSTGCDSSSLRIDWSASELGKGICWMKKLGRLAAR